MRKPGSAPGPFYRLLGNRRSSSPPLMVSGKPTLRCSGGLRGRRWVIRPGDRSPATSRVIRKQDKIKQPEVVEWQHVINLVVSPTQGGRLFQTVHAGTCAVGLGERRMTLEVQIYIGQSEILMEDVPKSEQPKKISSKSRPGGRHEKTFLQSRIRSIGKSCRRMISGHNIPD